MSEFGFDRSWHYVARERLSLFSQRNVYPMTLMLLTSSNGTVVLPPIWVS